MKRVFIWFGVLLILYSPVLAQQANKTFLVKVESENFRKAPSGDVICTLPAGTPLQYIKEEGNWVKVQIEGYIWKASLTTDPTEVTGFKFHALHILLKTEAEAQSVLAQLKNGADFQSLAEKYSIDPSVKRNRGDLGFFARGDLLKEFEDRVQELKPGETSGVIKTALGYHIIRRLQ